MSVASPATDERPERLSRRAVLAMAWPVVLAQAATALTGVVDTAVMGRVGGKVDLAAVGVAAVTISFLYWAFGFLRMSTTGLVAQANGAGRPAQARAHLVRALMCAAGLGLLCVVLARPVEWIALASFDAAADVEAGAAEYLRMRIWGAPAALMGYAVAGWLVGTGRTRALLAFEVVLNGVNAGFDALFAGVYGMGPAGIALGTAIAEWVSLLVGLALVRRALRGFEPLWDRAQLVALFAANRDILIRSLALLFAFAWFVDSGAEVGTAALAGNEVLLQFITVAAFVLDAFAFVAEKEVGEAMGGGSQQRLIRAIRLTSEFALGCGVVLALLFVAVGGPVIDWFVLDPAARAVAHRYLPYCASVPVIGMAAWQLDGIFIGATQGRALRNAAVLATAAYVVLDRLLAPRYGNTGVWVAFLLMYIARAAALFSYWPQLRRAVDRGDGDPPARPGPTDSIG